MPRKDSSLLGIDLNPEEIRVVHVKYKNGRPYVHRAGCCPMPHGVYSRGLVTQTGTLAVALRRLIDGMEAGGVDRAVFGLSSEKVVMRNLTIPAVPDSELDAVVEVEVDHFGIVQSRGGAHGFIPLISPMDGEKGSITQVAVLGVEEDVTSAIRELAERTGLEIAALEPSQLAMLRTAALGFSSAATAFVLMVGAASTDVAFFVNGSLIALRRLDIGSHSLVESIIPTVAFNFAQSVFDQPLNPGDVPEGISPASRMLNSEAVDRLCLETRRTMDYLQRQYPDFAVVDKVNVVLDSVELHPLGRMISEQLELPTDLVRPPSGGGDTPQASMEMGGDAGLKYATAFGLAMFESPVPSAKLTRIDLFSTQRLASKHEETKRNFAGAILVSALGLLVGFLGLFLYNHQIALVEQQTALTVSRAALVRSATNFTLGERANRATEFRALRKEGVPLGPVMDYLVASLQPGLGMKSVSITPDLKVTLIGDAVDETAMIQTSQNLQHSPILQNVMVNSFDRDKSFAGNAISFTLGATTVGAERIKLPPAPKLAAFNVKPKRGVKVSLAQPEKEASPSTPVAETKPSKSPLLAREDRPKINGREIGQAPNVAARSSRPSKRVALETRPIQTKATHLRRATRVALGVRHHNFTPRAITGRQQEFRSYVRLVGLESAPSHRSVRRFRHRRSHRPQSGSDPYAALNPLPVSQTLNYVAVTPESTLVLEAIPTSEAISTQPIATSAAKPESVKPNSSMKSIAEPGGKENADSGNNK